MTYSMFIGIKMLHRFLTFRSLISFFSVSLQASCCWDFQCTQSSISSPVSKNRKISSSFPQDWFFTMIHTPSWALHCIKKSSQWNSIVACYPPWSPVTSYIPFFHTCLLFLQALTLSFYVVLPVYSLLLYEAYMHLETRVQSAEFSGYNLTTAVIWLKWIICIITLREPFQKWPTEEQKTLSCYIRQPLVTYTRGNMKVNLWSSLQLK